jgi:hypothetical protein
MKHSIGQFGPLDFGSHTHQHVEPGHRRLFRLPLDTGSDSTECSSGGIMANVQANLPGERREKGHVYRKMRKGTGRKQKWS